MNTFFRKVFIAKRKIIILFLIFILYYGTFEYNEERQELGTYLVNNQIKKMLLYPVDICIDNKISLVFIVKSNIYNYDKRKLIRETWGNTTMFPYIRVVFVVGLSPRGFFNQRLYQENKKYKDLVQGDFLDTFKNRTNKIIIALKWISDFCNRANFYILMEDHVIPDVYDLESYLDGYEIKNSQSTLICSHQPRSKVVRDRKSKFYVPFETFSEVYFDQYCANIATVMTSDLPGKLYQASFNTAYFWMDDVYIGMIAKKIQASFISINERYIGADEVNFRKEQLTNEFYFFEKIKREKSWRHIWQNVIENENQ